MKHTHLAVDHLIARAESYREKQPLKNVRPNWVDQLTDDLAELFEPLSGTARVGFTCELADDRWEISMFLGKSEQVGGAEDGEMRFTNFQLNLRTLYSYFSKIERMSWNAIPEPELDDSHARSFIVLEGWLEEEPVCLRLFSTPPQEAGIGLKVDQNGEINLPQENDTV